MKKDRLRIILNQDKANTIFPRLIYLYEKGIFPWIRRDLLPEKRHIPKTIKLGSIEHRWFLWFVAIFMRGAIKSDTVFQALALLYLEMPELFNPETIAGEYSIDRIWGTTEEYSVERIRDILDPISSLGFMRSKNTGPFYWRKNAELRKWDWDPLNIFVGKTHEEIVSLLLGSKQERSFFGIGPKIADLLILSRVFLIAPLPVLLV